MLNNKKIQIAMLELSEQNKAVLEFYFDSAGEDFYTLVSKDKAEAFIADYDFPGAKDSIKQVLSIYNKPVVILSIKEQNIPSTVWLAKPLSASALTDTAVKLNELITNNEKTEVLEVKDTSIKDVITEEIEFKKAQEKLAEQEAAKEAGEIGDFFELLEEAEDDQVSEAHTTLNLLEKTAKSLAANASKKLKIDESIDQSIFETALSDGSSNEGNTRLHSDSDSEIEIENNISQDEIEPKNETTESLEATKTENSSLDFADVVIDAQNSAELNELVSESEVDALLESLILGEGNKSEIKLDKEETELLIDDSVDYVLENDSANSVDLVNSESETQGLLDDVSSKGLGKDEEIKAEMLVNDSESEIIKEDKHEFLEESFMLHDDLNPSDEDIYTETLTVDYADLKKSRKEPTNDVGKQQSADQKPDTAVENPLENDSFDSDIESEKKSDNSDKEKISEGTNKTAIEDLGLTLAADKKSSNADIDLDSLLQEISDENSLEETHRDAAESLPEINYEDDFGLDKNKNKQNSDNKESSYDEITIEDNTLEEEVTEDNQVDIDTLGKPIDGIDLFEDKFAKAQKTSAMSAESTNEKILPGIESKTTEVKSPEFELQSLLNEVRQEANKNTKNNAKGSDGFSGNGKINEYEQTKAEKRWIQLCGNFGPIKEQKEVAAMSFANTNHLLGSLLHQIENTKDSEQLFRMKYNDLIIVIDQSKDKIYCNLPVTTDEYSEICYDQINPLDIKIHDLDYSEVRLYRSKIQENTDRAHSIEAFVWITSLLTSRGRLPNGTDLKKKVGLKTWPNLTRLELIPHAMHIAAVFSKHPGSLLEIADWMNIHQRYVFAFYNAAFTLNMIETDSNKLKKASKRFGHKGTKKSAERGFFGRLIQRLKA